MTHKRQQAVVIEKEKIEVKLPKVLVLYFARADRPSKQIELKVIREELFERVVKRAAELLDLRGPVSVTGGGEPIDFSGKTVGQVVKEYGVVSFELASVDMLGL